MHEDHVERRVLEDAIEALRVDEAHRQQHAMGGHRQGHVEVLQRVLPKGQRAQVAALDDRQQLATLRTANDEALAYFDYSPFLKRYDAAVTEASVTSKNRETKRKIKKRLEEVLIKKLVNI